ncbi:MAG: hypothetical protein IT258_11420 [Saprospiraceae bacterium]|nr:hypothetical protein [Saprospiraceae bacterium]
MGHQEGGLYLTNEAREGLKMAANWSLFLAILGFLFVGLLLLGGIGMLLVGAVAGSGVSEKLPFPMWIFTLAYLGFAALYFFPVWYLYQFASRTKQALLRNDVQALTNACANIGKHYKFMGILTIVMIVLYFVLFFAMAGMGMAAAKGLQ